MQVADLLRAAADAAERLGITHERIYEVLPAGDGRMSASEVARVLGVSMGDRAERTALICGFQEFHDKRRNELAGLTPLDLARRRHAEYAARQDGWYRRNEPGAA